MNLKLSMEDLEKIARWKQYTWKLVFPASFPDKLEKFPLDFFKHHD